MLEIPGSSIFSLIRHKPFTFEIELSPTNLGAEPSFFTTPNLPAAQCGPNRFELPPCHQGATQQSRPLHQIAQVPTAGLDHRGQKAKVHPTPEVHQEVDLESRFLAKYQRAELFLVHLLANTKLQCTPPFFQMDSCHMLALLDNPSRDRHIIAPPWSQLHLGNTRGWVGFHK